MRESFSLEVLPEQVLPGAGMAPLPQMTCSAAGCDYSTPEGAPDFAAQLTCLSLHTQQAHPAQGAAGAALADRPTCKVDKRARPTVSMEMSEHDWRFFLSEWADYKRATGISGQNMLDELWSCMVPDLKRLAFDQGGKDLLNTEDLMLARLKLLAVSVLHAAVHTVSLHEARQMSEESTKAFAARVRGIAANCHLSKDCPAPCGKKVSFLEETVYHVVMAGLRDRDMQERCLSAAILKTITDINSLVEFCSAEESGRMSTPSTVGSLRASAYKKGKQSNRSGQQQQRPTAGRCEYCGGAPHSANTKEVREKECRAWSKECHTCHKVGHLAPVCKGKVKAKVQAMEESKSKVEQTEGHVDEFAFCFALEDQKPTSKQARKRRGLTAGYHSGHKGNNRQYPAVPKQAPTLPLRGHTAYPAKRRSPFQKREDPIEDPLLAALSSRRSLYLPPLCHMEYVECEDGSWAFKETGPVASPQLPVSLSLHQPSYKSLKLPPPLSRSDGDVGPAVGLAVSDSGAQMDVTSKATIESMGLDITSLVPVRARVFGPSRGAEIKMIGGILLKVEPPDGKGPSTVRLFYVAENVSRTYLSLATLKALGIVGPDFPRWPASTPRGAPYSRMTATQGAFQSLGQPGEYGSNTHQRTFDTNSAAGTSSQQSPAMDVPQPPVGPPSGPAHLYSTVTQGTFQSLGEPGGLCSNNVTNTPSLHSVAGTPSQQSQAKDVSQRSIGPSSRPAHLSMTVTQGTSQSLGKPGGVRSNNASDSPSFQSVAGAPAQQQPRSTRCSNSGVIMPGKEAGCSCPRRQMPPSAPALMPCSPTEENLPQLKQYLLDRYAASTFNVCEHQPLPLLQGSPPLELHVDPDARPTAVHTPGVVPLHWQQPVLDGLNRDVRLGVLERVPVNTPAKWQSRMVVTAKANGDPRRTVDFQAVNACSPRQTHHTQSPWHLVSSIPEGVVKTTFDCWHGYHSLKLASEADKDATTFITPWGRFRYLTCPQGFLSAGDAYTDRLDRLLEEFERQKRCIDDTLLYDETIEAAFHRACDFLDLCGKNGVILNPAKFQFAQSEVEYLGFNVTATGVQPTESFKESILSFPTPSSLTDIRSWFGAVAQVSYAFASSPVMQPFRHLLSSKSSFSWSPELEEAFLASKQEVVRQCEEGVRSFNPSLPTALATDWSKMAMGFWLCQKRCKCEGELRPGCCNTGWQTVYVGSRFCTGAEQRYSPICGEAASCAFGVDKCRFFLLGQENFLLCVDHRPLLKILSPQMDLGDITNPRLFNQKVKLLPYRFTPVYVPGKKHVVPDCYSRRGDSPILPSKPDTSVDLLDIGNVEPGYSDTFGPPAWVSSPAAGPHSGSSDPRMTVTQGTSQSLGNQGKLCSINSSKDSLTYFLAGNHSRHTYQKQNLGTRAVLAAFTARPLDAASAEQIEVTKTEEESLAVWGRTSLQRLQAEVAGVRPEAVRALTWARLKEATVTSHVYAELKRMMADGLPENLEAWPETLRAYFPHRHHLTTSDGVIMCGERPLIPTSLRQEVLEHLHAAHQGATKMLGRARESVFWPGLTNDVAAHRAGCHSCTWRAPSNPAGPPAEPIQPNFPFSHIVADFFEVDAHYLAMADRYSNWLSVFKLPKDDSANIIKVLRQYFARWGIPENFTSDGASVFTSSSMRAFFDRWGVEQRVSSAYYPRANKRAEVAVKSAKRLVMDNLGPGGSLDTDKFARALLAHRNCPDEALGGLSPSQIIFGRQLRDHLPALVNKYQPRQEWRLEADLRSKAMAKRHGTMEKWLQHGAKPLPPLSCGDTVAVQDLTDKGKPGRWTKSGTIVEVLPHDAYLVKVHGSRALTKRNRRFLRKLTPFHPASPVLPGESYAVPRLCSQPPAGTAAADPTASPEAPQGEVAPPPPPAHLPPAPTPLLEPHQEGPPQREAPTADTHRLRPVGAPGEPNMLELLKQREEAGYHLALETDTRTLYY